MLGTTLTKIYYSCCDIGIDYKDSGSLPDILTRVGAVAASGFAGFLMGSIVGKPALGSTFVWISLFKVGGDLAVDLAVSTEVLTFNQARLIKTATALAACLFTLTALCLAGLLTPPLATVLGVAFTGVLLYSTSQNWLPMIGIKA